jgi:hypothetical protein
VPAPANLSVPPTRVPLTAARRRSRHAPEPRRTCTYTTGDGTAETVPATAVDRLRFTAVTGRRSDRAARADTATTLLVTAGTPVVAAVTYR